MSGDVTKRRFSGYIALDKSVSLGPAGTGHYVPKVQIRSAPTVTPSPS